MFSIFFLIDFVKRIREIYSYILELFFPLIEEDDKHHSNGIDINKKKI